MITHATEWPPFQPPSYKSTHLTKSNEPNSFLGSFVLSDFPSYNSTHPTKPNEPIVSMVHLSFETFLRYKSTHPT